MSIRDLFRRLLGVALFTMAVRETLDPDLWWHLRTGELILNDGLPRTDPFSFTVSGTPWIAHEWLSDVFMWMIYRVGGLAALSLVFAGIIAVTFWLLYRRSDGQPYLAAFVILLAALTASPIWGARPQMFNLLLAAIFVYVIEGVFQERLSGRWLWLLVPLTTLWANLHSGYLFGIVLIGVYGVGAALDVVTGRFETPVGLRERLARGVGAMQSLPVVGVLSLFAALLTPHGFALWRYPFETLGSEAMQRFIVEWHSPDFHLTLFRPFAVMMGLGVVSWVASRRRPSWTELLLFFGGAAAGLISARNIALFAVVTPVMISRHLTVALEPTRLRSLLHTRPDAPALAPPLRLANWFILAAAVLGGLVWISQRIGNIETAVTQFYPVAAVDFIEESGLATERGFNSYGWGGYLIWRGIPVYADGRADVYGDFLFTYQETGGATTGWQAPLDRFGVTYALIEPETPLAALLNESDAWRVIYRDEIAAVFYRDEAPAP